MPEIPEPPAPADHSGPARAGSRGPGAGPSGADAAPPVVTDPGAGRIEAALLIVGAVRRAAQVIVSDTRAGKPDGMQEIVVMVGDSPPDLAGLDRYEAVRAALSDGLVQALAAAQPAPADRGIGDRGAEPPVYESRGLDFSALVPGLGQANQIVGAAADLVGSVTGLIQTLSVRTRFAAIEAGADDALLLREIAAALLAQRPRPRVRVAPLSDPAAVGALRAELDDLAGLEAQVAALPEPSAQAQAAAAAVHDFRTMLATPGPDGAVPFDRLAALRALRDALGRGAVLIVARVVSAGAGQFTRQGPLSGLLGDPTFEVSAAVVAGYAAFAGLSLDLVATGNVRGAMPYQPVRDVLSDHIDRAAAPV